MTRASTAWLSLVLLAGLSGGGCGGGADPSWGADGEQPAGGDAVVVAPDMAGMVAPDMTGMPAPDLLSPEVDMTGMQPPDMTGMQPPDLTEAPMPDLVVVPMPDLVIPGPGAPSTGIKTIVKSVSKQASDPIAVRFTLQDDRGAPVDIAGKYSVNNVMSPRFALGIITKDSNGIVQPLKMLTKAASSSNPTAMPTAFNPTGTAAGHGTLVENGQGDYTYTFPSSTTMNGPVAVAYDAAKMSETHVLWIQVARQTDAVYVENPKTFFVSNEPYYFIPSGQGTPIKREIVTADACSKCHNKFKPESATSKAPAFHGGSRTDPAFCNACHNPERTSNPAADSAVFVHRIHDAEHLQAANLFHGLAATYPQDPRNCDTCHKGAAQGDQAKTHPTRAACGSCHDQVDFVSKTLPLCTDPPAVDDKGVRVPCKHSGGPQADDKNCSVCHTADKMAETHKPVVPPDPNNSLLVAGGNANTNAAYMAAGGYVPAGAAVISYDVKSVEAVADMAIGTAKRPQITFKLKRDGKDVAFQTYAAGSVTELMAGFVGSPSVYFAFAVPQDGIAKPADFNATASAYIKNIWNGTATGTAAGTISGPDASGYYTIKLTGVQVPANATMLTGGLGYTYSLTSTQPLTQVDLPDYPYTASNKQGGLIVPAKNVWKVATGYTGRRAIVDNARCNNCHGGLGVAPSFHAGQRNDGPSCSFCHTPNRTSSAWSAGSKYFVHAVHGGRMRTDPFTWHATEPGPGYGEIEFPSPLNYCQSCHLPGTHDLSASASAAAVPNMLLTTVGTGKYNKDPLVNKSYYTLSPYVVADGVKDHGAGFAYAAATGVTTEAAATTLVITPITTACIACHDSPAAQDHMTTNGGRFYSPRSEVLPKGAPKEQCQVCHGPGRLASTGSVHF